MTSVAEAGKFKDRQFHRCLFVPTACLFGLKADLNFLRHLPMDFYFLALNVN